MRVTDQVTLFATAAWLASACAPDAAMARQQRLLQRSADGRQFAAVVEIAGAGSLVLLAQAAGEAGGFDPGRLLAAFDRRIDTLQWQGEDLLLGIATAHDVRAFSVCPGIRNLPAPAPEGAASELAWLRLSTRRSRR